MRKLVLVLVLVSVVLGGYKAAVWYGTLNWMNAAQATIENAGVLSWESVDSTLGGQVTVNGLRLQLFDLTLPIRVGAVSFSRPTPWALLKTLYGNRKVPPADWTLSVDNLDMALVPGLFKSWAAGAEGNPSRDAFVPWGLYACGARRTLNSAQLIAMGVHQVHGSASLVYRTDMQAGLVRSKLAVNAGTLGSFDMNVVTPPPARWDGLGNPSAWPIPQSLQLVLRDGGFMRRISAYCSTQGYDSEQRWSQSATQAWREDLAKHGIMPGKTLLDLYENWMENGGELSLALQPQDDVTGKTLLQGTPDQALQALGFRLAYNGSPVQSPSVSLDRGTLTRSLAPPAANDAAPVKHKSAPPAPDYLDTPVAQAAGWVGRMVKVTYGSRALEGRLDRVDDNTLQVAQNVQGGVVEYPVPKAQVTALKVWRTPDEAPPHPLPAPQAPANDSGSAAAPATMSRSPDTPAPASDAGTAVPSGNGQ